MRVARKAAVTLALPLLTTSFAAAGNLFITGHDSDNHGNSSYIRAGLDYLSFGHAAAGAEVAARATKKVAYIANIDGGTSDINSAGYNNGGVGSVFLDVDLGTWTDAFGVTGGVNNFDILVIGSGLDYFTTSGISTLTAAASSFTSYFNNGGSIFVHTDEERGQSFYNFIPNFGSTTNNSISNVGIFSATPAGNAIGLTEAIVDADITHSYYTNVSSIFTVFETHNPTGSPVAIGVRGAQIIDDGGGGQIVNPVPLPSAATAGLCLAAGLLASRRRTPSCA